MKDIQTISTEGLNGQSFFSKYIASRQPVKFNDHFNDGDLWQFGKWTNEYLKKKAGDSRVKIEFRDSPSGRYGKGHNKQYSFGEFLSELESGNESLYMTTQKLQYSPEGQPDIISEPIKGLVEDFPLNPPLMGNLVVQNINMWMGCTSEPSTSGLHHDFHDNIYIVLRGSKQITLFPPEEHANMYLVGQVSKLHPNGRFNYAGKMTNADGSSIGAAESLLAANQLDSAALKLDKDEGPNSEAEEEIENALEALLDAQMAAGGDDDDDDDDDCEGQDDYQDSDNNYSEEEEEGSEGGRGIKRILSVAAADDCQLVEEPTNRRQRVQDTSEDSGSDDDEDEEEGGSLESGDPPSFSRVDTSLPEDALLAEFPLFVEARDRSMITVQLEAGQMLYLPAGWFHEVKSVGPPPQGHLAFNFWFHPPDGNTYEKPYLSDFWEMDWKSREKTIIKK